ncbi:hypothetical protein Droror1_Dr00027786 [Drosera rotundifolia]
MGRSSTRGGRGKGRSSVRIHIGRSPPPSIVASVTAATPATLSARGGKGKGRSSVGIHIHEQTTPPPSIVAPATAATPDVPVVPTVGATLATLSARGGRGKGPSSGGIHIQEQTTPPLSIAAPATAATPDVPVVPTVGATPATLSARGGRGKGPSSGGIHIQEQTTPPPFIGVAAPAPVFTPTTVMGFTTPIAPAHASASATSDPISSSIGEIRVSPGSQPSSSRGPSSLPQLFVGPGGQYEIKKMHEYGELAKLVEDNLKRNVGTSKVYVATHKKNDKFSSKKAKKIYALPNQQLIIDCDGGTGIFCFLVSNFCS